MSPVGMPAECLGDLSGTVADLLRDAGLPWSYTTGEGAVALEHHADRTGAMPSSSAVPAAAPVLSDRLPRTS